MDNLVVLGLGSNRPWNSNPSIQGGLVDCYNILKMAIAELGNVFASIQQASIYETEPIPKSSQNNFFNTAVSGFFKGSAEELLTRIHQIEAMFGRDRSKEIRWGERSLDIDILLFGDKVLNTQALTIPHPRLEERRFALEPLLELIPEAVSPKTGVPYREICDTLPEQGVVKTSY